LLLKFTAPTLTAGVTTTYYNLSKHLTGSKKILEQDIDLKYLMLKTLRTEEFSNPFFFFPASPPCVRGMHNPQQLTLCGGLTLAKSQMPTQPLTLPLPQQDR